jgi:LEA14-like dessication related protein
MKLIRYSGLIIALLFIFGACKNEIKQPDFLGLKNVKVHSVGLKESRLKLDIHLYNPNQFPLEAKYADLDITLDNRFLGKTILDTLIQVPARDSILVPVELRMEMKQLFPQLLSVATRDSVNLGIDGYVKLKRAGIFLKLPVHYKGRKKLEF